MIIQPKFLEHPTTQSDATMAGDTSCIDKGFYSQFFFHGQGIVITIQIFIESTHRIELSFKGTDRFGNGIEGDRLHRIRIDFFESTWYSSMPLSFSSRYSSDGRACSTGLRRGPPACSSTSVARPSQNCIR